MLVNNRPDGEEPDQPLASNIEAAAAAAGIGYRFMPIIRGIGPADVEAMQEALRDAGDGKLLAFCRSGTRSALTWALAHARRGRGARGGRAAGDRGRLQHRPDRAPALGVVVSQQLARIGESSSSTISRTPTNRAVGIVDSRYRTRRA